MLELQEGAILDLISRVEFLSSVGLPRDNVFASAILNRLPK